MQDILVRASCFVAIILLGYTLRRVGFFKAEDFIVLSKIVVKITLPAAIVTSFAGKEIDFSMLSLGLIGLGGGIVYMILGYLMNIRQGKAKQSFAVINTAGYNIGNFTLPFVQNFLGPVGVIATSLFDTGNACICLGGSYSIASIIKEGGRFSVTRVGMALFRSVAFDCYVICILMNLFRIPMPEPVVDFAQIIANGNAFMAMLMIGVGFRLSGDFGQIKDIMKILAIRYGFAALLACGCYVFLPFELEVRQALVILAFSPIASAAPGFTEEINGDAGLASAVNSISIVCSIVIIVGLLMIML